MLDNLKKNFENVSREKFMLMLMKAYNDFYSKTHTTKVTTIYCVKHTCVNNTRHKACRIPKLINSRPWVVSCRAVDVISGDVVRTHCGTRGLSYTRCTTVICIVIRGGCVCTYITVVRVSVNFNKITFFLTVYSLILKVNLIEILYMYIKKSCLFF